MCEYNGEDKKKRPKLWWTLQVGLLINSISLILNGHTQIDDFFMGALFGMGMTFLIIGAIVNGSAWRKKSEHE